MRLSALIRDYPWLAYVLPFGVYLGLGVLEPAAPPGGSWEDSFSFPLFYGLRLALTLVALLVGWPEIRRWLRTPRGFSILLGLLGGLLWIGLSRLGLEARLLDTLQPVLAPLGVSAESLARRGYNPWEDPSLAAMPARIGFLAVRLVGLVLVVPLIEEAFLRGFFCRWLDDDDWRDQPIGRVNRTVLLGIAAYAAVTHPAEWMTAILWFLMVTWLVSRTRNLADAMLAHAATNLTLGVYIIAWGDWSLW